MHFVAKNTEKVFAIILGSQTIEFITNATGPTVTELSKAIGLFKHKVKLLHCGPLEGVMYKDELLRAGLHLNVDFVWSYHPSLYDNFVHDPVVPKHVMFEFQDAATATFYQLKWA